MLSVFRRPVKSKTRPQGQGFDYETPEHDGDSSAATITDNERSGSPVALIALLSILNIEYLISKSSALKYT
jgi:hypothetical protein